ncbi:MAG TPA: FkbM family methyltransferase [Terriglobales bacterium]|nr:FkbM family methyltransferase [Terriglobales bacterium]
MKYRSRTLAGLDRLIPGIVYVMCGARGETGKLPIRGLSRIQYIGFEADPKECERLQRNARPGFRFENAIVAGRTSRRILYVTREPSCSSLLRPNAEVFSLLLDGKHATEILREETVQTQTLGELLPKLGVEHVDFLDLDTQGTELEILQGAERFLSTSVVAIRTEAEFTELYEGQPLFAEVDRYLRDFGFVLFDLSRSRCRRRNLQGDQLTRGQLLWGDAVYLRDYGWFESRSSTDGALRLCMVAAHLGFHDYALEGIDRLLSGAMGALSPAQEAGLREARDQYRIDLKSSARWIAMLNGLDFVGLRRPVKAVGRLARQLGDRLVKDKEMTQHNWID